MCANHANHKVLGFNLWPWQKKIVPTQSLIQSTQLRSALGVYQRKSSEG